MVRFSLGSAVNHAEILRARFGHDRVVPATRAVEAEKIGPGRFLQRSPVVRLNMLEAGEPLLGGVAARLGHLGFVWQFIGNEQTLLWSKLCFLGPFALVTSASGMNNGEILAKAEWKQNLLLPLPRPPRWREQMAQKLTRQRLAIYDSTPPGMRSSMQKDLAAGRQLELDAIGGPIVRGGERYRIDVSTTADLMAAIQ